MIREDISFSEKVLEEYIEMLADDRVKEVIPSANIIFTIDGEKYNRLQYWNSNRYKIINKIREDKYKSPKYEKALIKINTYIFDYEKEYIEMLKDDRIKEIKGNEPITFNVYGKQVVKSNYWNTNKAKVKLVLGSYYMYEKKEYDIVREKIDKYYEKRNMPALISEKILEEYIEMLADDRVKLIDPNGTVIFTIDGEEYSRIQYWNANKARLERKMLEEKYIDSRYDLVRLKMVAAQDKKLNKDNLALICNDYNIDYKLNKKYIDRIPYRIFKSILMYLIDNNINYIDSEGLLISDFYMSSIDFSNKYGISIQELLNKEKRI